MVRRVSPRWVVVGAVVALALVGLPVRTASGVVVDAIVVAAAGDIACDPSDPAFNDGNGSGKYCRQRHTANLLAGVDRVLAVGDTQYTCGALSAYEESYDLSWGAYRDITHPVPGDEEYGQDGTGCGTPGSGYFGYFGTAAHGPRGYYSFDFGGWHFIALNSECNKAGGCNESSPQNTWLEQDLAANDEMCTLAFFHRPRFKSKKSGSQIDGSVLPFWNDLYAAGAEIVLGGNSHFYERFAPQTPSGVLDNANGIRQWVVGTGGKSHGGLADPTTRLPNSQTGTKREFGVLKLTLHPTSYDWEFDVEGSTSYSDTGSATCH